MSMDKLSQWGLDDGRAHPNKKTMGGGLDA